MSRKATSLLSTLALASLALTGTVTPTAASEKTSTKAASPAAAPEKLDKSEEKPNSYTIRSGDTLTGIADKQHQKYRDLLGRNKQFWKNPDLIHPGEKVKLTGKVHSIPAPPRASRSYVQPRKQSQPQRTPATAAPAPKPRVQSTAPTTSGSPKGYAQSVLPAGQFSCINSLFNRESGWNIYATNPSSGAYGIPQALPGSKMASAGADWRTNGVTQVKWGISYVNSRYGSACGAWSHFLSKNWY